MRYKLSYSNPEGEEFLTEIDADSPEQAVEVLKVLEGEQLASYHFEDKAILKFNNGALAILCSECYKIIKVGNIFSQEEIDYAAGKIMYLPPQYCDEHKK